MCSRRNSGGAGVAGRQYSSDLLSRNFELIAIKIFDKGDDLVPFRDLTDDYASFAASFEESVQIPDINANMRNPLPVGIMAAIDEDLKMQLMALIIDDAKFHISVQPENLL